jgi:hypothetical protein
VPENFDDHRTPLPSEPVVIEIVAPSIRSWQQSCLLVMTILSNVRPDKSINIEGGVVSKGLLWENVPVFPSVK